VSDHEQPPRNFVAVLLEGPSRIGHYFRAHYQTAHGEGLMNDSGPILRPDGATHAWSIHYLPRGGNGYGEITVKLDNEEKKLALKPEHRKQGAAFDRFGLFNLQVGGHFVDVAIDDLTCTTASKRQ
jgi:hypothetical protein